MPNDDQPWKPAKATEMINAISRSKTCGFSYKLHAKERMDERGLLVSDVLYVLRHGYVYAEPEASTLNGFYKYQVESQSPNSGARFLRVVDVPDAKSCQIKVITIMWRDEK
jgi:hypothetical protein